MNIIVTLIIVLFVICIISIIICHNSISVNKYYIENNKIPSDFDNFKIVHLSDLHSRVFGKDNYKLIAKLLEENPNIIVMTGDMVNGRYKDIDGLERLIKEINKVNKKHIPIYYIMGNREFTYNKEDYIKFIKMLEKNNIIVLDNKKDEIILKGSSITIFGINYNNRVSEDYYNQLKAKSIKKEINNDISSLNIKLDKDKYNILLSHSPDDFIEYSNIGFDLILTGHMHGGVIRVPILDKGVLSPQVKLFPKYDKGLYENNRAIMCVSAGIGYGTIPFRLFNKPEIVSITLKNDRLHT